MKTEENILIAFVLNMSFSILELIGGIFTKSVAIISDSLHDFSDAISIGISCLLEKKSKKNPDNVYTFGYTRYSILGAFITNIILIIGSIFIIYHAILRILNPVSINYKGMIILAILGTVINLLAVYFTKDGHSLNQKAVNLHMLEDVLGWGVVLIGAIIMHFTKINIIDSILSIFVASFVLINAIKSLKKILDLILQKIPEGINIENIKNKIRKIENVIDIHHIHLWSMDGINHYITMHVVIETGDYEKIKCEIKGELKRSHINHSTIEFEKKESKCKEIDCHVDLEESSHHH